MAPNVNPEATVATPLRTSALARDRALALPEVITNILSKLPGPRDLNDPITGHIPSNLCRVSKLWLRPARRLLYSVVSVQSVETIIAFHRTLAENPKLGVYVRVLTMVPIVFHSWDPSTKPTGESEAIECIPGIVAACSRLRYLYVDKAEAWAGPETLPMCPSLFCLHISQMAGSSPDTVAIRRNFPNIKSLAFSLPTQRPSGSILPLPSFSGIRTLSIAFHHFNSLDGFGSTLPLSFPELDTLVFQGPFEHRDEHQISVDFPKLVNLVFSRYDFVIGDVDILDVWPLVKTLTKNLRTLTIILEGALDLAEVLWLDGTSPTFEVLSVYSGRLLGDPGNSRFLDLLRVLGGEAFPNFRKLKIGCYMDITDSEAPEGTGWDPAKEALAKNRAELDISELDTVKHGNLVPSPWARSNGYVGRLERDMLLEEGAMV